jgi:hypothetical protein
MAGASDFYPIVACAVVAGATGLAADMPTVAAMEAGMLIHAANRCGEDYKAIYPALGTIAAHTSADAKAASGSDAAAADAAAADAAVDAKTDAKTDAAAEDTTADPGP